MVVEEETEDDEDDADEDSPDSSWIVNCETPRKTKVASTDGGIVGKLCKWAIRFVDNLARSEGASPRGRLLTGSIFDGAPIAVSVVEGVMRVIGRVVGRVVAGGLWGGSVIGSIVLLLGVIVVVGCSGGSSNRGGWTAFLRFIAYFSASNISFVFCFFFDFFFLPFSSLLFHQHKPVPLQHMKEININPNKIPKIICACKGKAWIIVDKLNFDSVESEDVVVVVVVLSGYIILSCCKVYEVIDDNITFWLFGNNIVTGFVL